MQQVGVQHDPSAVATQRQDKKADIFVATACQPSNASGL
jgi:hypothetical protein